jgi:ABC-type transport system involved in multi-copper enzyme maturation permease subunit
LISTHAPDLTLDRKKKTEFDAFLSIDTIFFVDMLVLFISYGMQVVSGEKSEGSL